MSVNWRFIDDEGTVQSLTGAPEDSRPFLSATEWLLPPLITDLHQSFHRWGAAGLHPGPVVPERLRISRSGTVAFRFDGGAPHSPFPSVGGHAALAAWLVLLDKFMETYVVVARARAIWSVSDLASALAFITPGLLPHQLVALPPDNWETVARSLAMAVADGPMQGEAVDRHWMA